jgi:hypothetical protein
MNTMHTAEQKLNLALRQNEAPLSPDFIALPLASIGTQTCFTPFCAANTSRTTSNCLFSRVRKTVVKMDRYMITKLPCTVFLLLLSVFTNRGMENGLV